MMGCSQAVRHPPKADIPRFACPPLAGILAPQPQPFKVVCYEAYVSEQAAHFKGSSVKQAAPFLPR